MNLKAVLLATATVALLSLIAACGGDSVGAAGDSTPSQPGISGGRGTPAQTQPAGSDDFGISTSLKYVTIDLNCSPCDSASGFGIGGGEQSGVARFSGYRHNVIWRGSAATMVDLGDVGEAGAVVATSGGIQVGWRGNDKFNHAIKWRGSASSVDDIHPATLRESKALGIAGDQIIGYGISEWYMPGDHYFHALLWTNAGVVDLNPSGYEGSAGFGTDGRQQVGYGVRSAGTGLGAACCSNHALLWSGTAESVVDLHPVSGYDATSANAVSGGQQVGWGAVSGSTANPASRHALLWMGTAESVVDLHPSGLLDSTALAVAQGRQVGWGTSTDGTTHALLWNGTADSVVDLHVFLPPGFAWSSANGIDAAGNIIGSAIDANGASHAILWVPQ